jgi:hypothetical protein
VVVAGAVDAVRVALPAADAHAADEAELGGAAAGVSVARVGRVGRDIARLCVCPDMRRRVVHGGPRLCQHIVVDTRIRQSLQAGMARTGGSQHARAIRARREQAEQLYAGALTVCPRSGAAATIVERPAGERKSEEGRAVCALIPD